MATSIGNLDIGLLVGVVGGVGSFFRGFRAYRQYLLLQGTPEIPIRSISMGLVRVHGKVASERLVTSPISHTPCCLYQVRIEKWKDEGDSGKWLHYGAEVDGVRFYLEDSSGRVLVDPRDAEYDIETTAVREASSASAWNVAGASDVELLTYVARVGAGAELPGSWHNLEVERGALAMARFAGHPTDRNEIMRQLLGPRFAQLQQAEAKMQLALEAEGPRSDSLSEELRLAQIELHKHPVWSPEYAEGFKRVTKLQAQKRKAVSRGEIRTPDPPPPSSQIPAAGDIVASVDGVPSAAGRYRVTERCILPDHEYDITGTCGENPEARDATDSNLIRKGTNEPTFLISGLAQPDVNAMLQIRANLLIFGGGMLAVFCLGLLLLRFGQF